MSSRPPLFGLYLGILISLLLPSRIQPQLSWTGNVTTTYPNDNEGLRRLLNDMLVAAKSEDASKLKSLLQQAEIPNYENWFTTNFGEEKGESWAGPTEGGLRSMKRSFKNFW
jgi:hypothetical protein